MNNKDNPNSIKENTDIKEKTDIRESADIRENEGAGEKAGKGKSGKGLKIAAAVAAVVVLAVLITLFVKLSLGKNPENCNHADKDDNGICDKCSTSVLISFDIFAINDLHGRFADTDKQPGVDELTTFLKYYSEDYENTILFSSGDMWQGSSESNLTKGNIITEWMNDLGFVSMTLGNHEFDWGEEAIVENSKLAEFPFLAINLVEKSSGKRVDYCESSVVIERNGVKIGIIGAIGDCYSSISADKTKNINILVGSELTSLVIDEAQKLRAEGVDIIIYSVHDGAEKAGSVISENEMSAYYNTALYKYVDVVFEGHTHKQYVALDKNGVYHLQDGGENQGISHVELVFNIANSKKSVKEAEIISSSTYKESGSDPVRDQLLSKYDEQIAVANDVLATIPAYVNGDTLRNLVAELYYEKGVEVWGKEYDILLGGGFISIRNPYSLEKGDVKYADLYSLFPFDNELVICSIKGSDVKRVFFENENANYFFYVGDYYTNVVKSIDVNATYYVITDTYSSTYRSNNMTEIKRLGKEIYARDLLAEFLKKGGKIK